MKSFLKNAPSSLFLKLNIVTKYIKDRLELSVLSTVLGREKIISTFDLEFPKKKNLIFLRYP